MFYWIAMVTHNQSGFCFSNHHPWYDNGNKKLAKSHIKWENARHPEKLFSPFLSLNTTLENMQILIHRQSLWTHTHTQRGYEKNNNMKVKTGWLQFVSLAFYIYTTIHTIMCLILKRYRWNRFEPVVESVETIDTGKIAFYIEENSNNVNASFSTRSSFQRASRSGWHSCCCCCCCFLLLDCGVECLHMNLKPSYLWHLFKKQTSIHLSFQQLCVFFCVRIQLLRSPFV